MEKCIICIGGGEIKEKTTIDIDRYIANKAKARAKLMGKTRANALFFGTASRDSFPYFNSFRKTYTSIFDIKADVALLIKEPNMQAIFEKMDNADMIYVGGGDTKFMIECWQSVGLIERLKDAYERGVIICGLSAGAICWFDYAYSDWNIAVSNDYTIMEGLGFLRGLACPHYDQRREFDSVVGDYKTAYAISNNSAIEFIDGQPTKVLGLDESYIFQGENNESSSTTSSKCKIKC